MPRYLTKSRFKLALDCPAKLYYTGKPQYPDANSNNSFLEALAEGGYQVGELAKCYYPQGVMIEERGYDIPVQKTNELLERDNVVVFEAAFKYKNLFIRTDIIEKRGNRVDLIEVKAKSFAGTDYLDMLNKSGFLDTSWVDYVYDVAFQKYVITQAFPDWEVNAFLMLADKNAIATVNGLNQKFQLVKADDERTTAKVVGDVSKAGLGEEVLIRICVDDIIERIFQGTDSKTPPIRSFVDSIHFFADKYERDEKIITPINKDCKSCEYRTTEEEQQQGKLSGFKECWSTQLAWSKQMFDQPLILDIWDFRKKDEMIEAGKYLMKDLQALDIGDITPASGGALSRAERQWLQVRKAVDKDSSPYIDIEGMRAEMQTFVYPLHFIDFETSMLAIPFYEGRRPYEQTAFQFSHHVVNSDFTIEHRGQYLCREKGVFPNFEFVRQLKAELDQDLGSVFRYANHENTVLNQILVQLQEATVHEVPDRTELMDFIKTITHGANHNGNRDMIDLLDLVKKYYYHPRMGGSNSLKYVLPAILTSSEHIQTKYSQPIYGLNSEIRSLNYEDGWVWIKKDEAGNIISPYKLLPPLFENIDDEQIEDFLMRSDIKDGGAAMTAYAKMQFAEISEIERDLIIKGLLKYCELDTLAMVLIWEYWNNITK
jgi:hypothetical protein